MSRSGTPTPTWPAAAPDGWVTSKAQYVLNYVVRPPRADDEIVTAFRDGTVTLRSNRREDGFTNSLKEIGYQHVSRGDLVVHSMDGGFGAIGVADSSGKASPVVHAYRSDVCDVYFMAYYLRAAVTSGWIAAQTKGIRQRSTQFDRTSLAQLYISFPPLDEQRRIADFLDRETAEIDSMDTDLDRLIETLQERRRAAVELTVWENGDRLTLVPLRAVAAPSGMIVDGDWIESKDQDPEGDIRLLQLADVGDGEFRNRSNRHITSETFTSLSCTEVLAGDVLVARMPDPIARAAIVPEGLGRTITAVDVAIVRPGHAWDNRYVTYAINSKSFRNVVESMITGSTRQRVSRSNLERVPVPQRDLAEQRHIADRLDRETAEIDSMIADARRLKEVLAERRSVLISDVVTGRKEVPA